MTDEVMRRLRRIRRLAWLLDAAVRVPGTRFRLGAASLVGLFPAAGSLVLGMVSLSIVWQAWRMGVPRVLLMRMIVNVALETLVDTVPLAGDAFDTVFKANMRNVALVERYLNVGPGPWRE
ncbi:DUF4112 domain-containing protein [Gluconacetobacter diazotrophicus]|uniref:DUF4112 domain-containing protein n=1 Tax=Gluconacetobacter diazotrophicus TaxID=33996 RepID=UPI0002EC60AE